MRKPHGKQCCPFPAHWSPQGKRRGFQVDLEPLSKNKTTAATKVGPLMMPILSISTIRMFSSFQPPTKCFSIEHPIHQSNQYTSNLKAASKQLQFQKEIRSNLVIRSKLILSGKSLKTNHGTEMKMTILLQRK